MDVLLWDDKVYHDPDVNLCSIHVRMFLCECSNSHQALCKTIALQERHIVLYMRLMRSAR